MRHPARGTCTANARDRRRSLQASPVIGALTMRGVSERGPNVVLFVVDDMGWTDSGAYGSTYYETPNIDALAVAGTMFTDAYAASPLCSPTRASLLTGKYPARLGLTAPDGHLDGPDDLAP